MTAQVVPLFSKRGFPPANALTKQELAGRLRVSPRTIERYMKMGLPYDKPFDHGAVRFRLAEVDAWMSSLRAGHVQPPKPEPKRSAPAPAPAAPAPAPASLSDEVVTQLPQQLQQPSPVTGPFLDVTGAAAYLACTESRIRELEERGELTAHRDGDRQLFSARDLDAYVSRGGSAA